mgnify:CR=1 FL=1
MFGLGRGVDHRLPERRRRRPGDQPDHLVDDAEKDDVEADLRDLRPLAHHIGVADRPDDEAREDPPGERLHVGGGEGPQHQPVPPTSSVAMTRAIGAASAADMPTRSRSS